MKKFILVSILISSSAFALDLDAAKSLGNKAADIGKGVFAACKSEQVEFCKNYKELGPLKECLTKNKEKLSDGCKKAVGL